MNDLLVDEVRRLMWSLQALAAPADAQVTLYPSGVVTADELALDFDQWYGCAQSSLTAQWSVSQRTALAALNAKLNAMSRGGPEFTEDQWLESALASNSNWERVRDLARTALRLFGWPTEIPPRVPGIRGTCWSATERQDFESP